MIYGLIFDKVWFDEAHLMSKDVPVKFFENEQVWVNGQHVQQWGRGLRDAYKLPAPVQVGLDLTGPAPVRRHQMAPPKSRHAAQWKQERR